MPSKRDDRAGAVTWDLRYHTREDGQSAAVTLLGIAWVRGFPRVIHSEYVRVAVIGSPADPMAAVEVLADAADELLRR